MKQNREQVVVSQGITNQVLAFREAGNMRPDISCERESLSKEFSNPDDLCYLWLQALISEEVNICDFIGQDKKFSTEGL